MNDPESYEVLKQGWNGTGHEAELNSGLVFTEDVGPNRRGVKGVEDPKAGFDVDHGVDAGSHFDASVQQPDLQIGIIGAGQ